MTNAEKTVSQLNLDIMKISIMTSSDYTSEDMSVSWHRQTAEMRTNEKAAGLEKLDGVTDSEPQVICTVLF